ncbi:MULTISPECIES: minor capsid protein [unclassified Paenibacillus]|uniref:minor capsid protein n=1 Tax=unclassified Paenibacillus TaxID=185978 RepID=UPI0024073904|nr:MULTISPECIES: minor capsid protein [unclassified Paenibacillus]
MNNRAMNRLRAAPERALIQVVEGAKESILSDIMVSEVVPKQTGELERSATIDASKSKRGKVTITYDTPYARRLYWHPEYSFRKDKNRHAQGEWLKAWAEGAKTRGVTKAFKALLKKLAGGFIR